MILRFKKIHKEIINFVILFKIHLPILNKIVFLFKLFKNTHILFKFMIIF